MELIESMIQIIGNGGHINQRELVPYLCAENKQDRLELNMKLADAYFKAGNASQAKVFIRRAWLLSGFDQFLLPLYIEIHLQLNDFVSIREAYKRFGVYSAQQNNVADALAYFNKWQYVNANLNNSDFYYYDFDILDSIRKMAEPYKTECSILDKSADRRIKIAYLMFGLYHENSVIVRISQIFAQFNDKKTFDIVFFVPEQEHIIDRLKQARENIEKIANYGYKVVVAPDCKDEVQSLVKLSLMIKSFNPDILVTSAALADMAHYFILSTRPAPVIIGFLQGPPPQFIPPDIDWSIAWSKHPHIDSPTNCTLIPLEIEHTFEDVVPSSSTRELFDIPTEAIVLASAGRHLKFQSAEYWRVVGSIIQGYDNVYLVVIGMSDDQHPLAYDELSKEIKSKIRFVDWCEEYLIVLNMADIVIDTFPSGAGVILLDAMNLGKPVVAFMNDYMKEFDQSEWSPAEELIDQQELLAEHGDSDGLIDKIQELVENRTFRVEMGKSCKAQVSQNRSNPLRMVRACEKVYIKCFNNYVSTLAGKDRLIQLEEKVSNQPIYEHVFDTASCLNDFSENVYNSYNKDVISGTSHIENKSTMFTVIIPTYNHAHYLPACLESLLAQTCSNWEAVIVNDGSTDGTRVVLEQYAKNDTRLRVFHKQNGGAASALNLALENARGKWICWLSSDDMFESDRLEILVHAIAGSPGCYFFHSNYSVFFEESGKLSAIEVPDVYIPPPEEQVLRFLEMNYVNGISVAVHHSVFERIGYFNSTLLNGQDFDMWLRISSCYRSEYIDRRTCITRIHPGQGSSISANTGIYDAGRAILYFLNQHRFEELFPLIDLSQPEQGLRAIQAVLKILVNPLAYLNCCGFGVALLGRMREWLGLPEQNRIAGELSGALFDSIVESIVAADISCDLKEAFLELQCGLGAPFNYQPLDAVKLFERHSRFMESVPGCVDDAVSLRQYLARTVIRQS